ncbi:MAG: malate dehydrogenase [Thermaerobacter sp.]|nr:malate dehydrogenase [Thermaerobacter sp.]
MARDKIAVIGAGHVGATAAHWMAQRHLGDIVLVDVAEGIPQGKALDLEEASPLAPWDERISGTQDLAQVRGAGMVVLTAGAVRKPGMSRDDLLAVNRRIVEEVARGVAEQAPEACLLVVTNPVDVMTYLAWRTSGFPAARVFGMAGVLDSTRFRTFLARELGVSVRDVSAFVLGGHGDQMVPLVRYSYVGGIPVQQLLSPETIQRLVERTRSGGGEIVSLLKSGSAYYAPGASIAEMVEAVLRDQRRILPTVAQVAGEYGERDIYVGVPAVLGEGGVRRVLEIELNEEERQAFAASAAAVRRVLSQLG